MRTRQPVRTAGRWRTVVGLVLVSGYLFPIYWMVTASFKTQADIHAVPPQLFPTNPDLSTWQVRIFADPRVLNYVTNSFIVATGTMVLTVVLAAPAAYALARYRLRGGGVIMFFCLSSLMFPAIMLATPLFVIFNQLALTDTYLGLVLADTTLALPYAIVLLRPTFARIPAEYTEAALIDGCSAPRAFVSVVLPLAKAGLATVSVLSFLWAWGDLVFALTLVNDEDKRPVTTGLWAFFGANTSDWGGAMAFSTLAMLPPLLIFLWSQRFVVAGLGAGGVKG